MRRVRTHRRAAVGIAFVLCSGEAKQAKVGSAGFDGG